MAGSHHLEMRSLVLVLGMSLGVWVATSCDTSHVNGYTAGRGVTGNNCPAVMKEGESCHATCAVNSTYVGTIKCMKGELQDVSMCVSTPLLDKLAVVEVTKVVGSWSLALSKAPSNVQLSSAVVSGLGIQKHFIECVWVGGKAPTSPYVVNYWVIVKPGMDPKVIADKIHGFSQHNATEHQRFKASIEGFGMSIEKIKDAKGVESLGMKAWVPPTVVTSHVLKDPLGRNINPFGSSPGEGQGLDSWQ